MNQTLSQLLAIMDAEMNGYREMQAILVKEREATSFSQSDRLLSVGEEKRNLIQAIQAMEKQRQALTERLANEHGIQAGPLTVSRLADYLDDPNAARLAERAREMKSMIKTVQRENNANAQLFTHFLELIRGSLNLLNDLVYTRHVYPKPGGDHRMPGYGGNKGRVFCETI